MTGVGNTALLHVWVCLHDCQQVELIQAMPLTLFSPSLLNLLTIVTGQDLCSVPAAWESGAWRHFLNCLHPTGLVVHLQPGGHVETLRVPGEIIIYMCE